MKHNLTYLSTLLATTFLTGNALAEIASGTDCGPGCSWSISDDGVLTVTGADENSRMNDFQYKLRSSPYGYYTTAPWHNYKQQISAIDVNIPYIGDNAFQEMGGGIRNLNIGENVTSIGTSAFSTLSGITELNIPNSVTSIGANAFNKMSGVTGELVIPDTVTSISGQAFQNMSGVTSLTIPDSVTSIGNSAFSGMSGITELTIPDSVTSIGNSAFYGMSGITELTIPDSVTSIGDDAFRGMSGLTSLTLGKNMTNISPYVFRDMDPTNLTELNISDTLSESLDLSYLINDRDFINAASQYEWARERYERYLEYGMSEEDARRNSMLDNYKPQIDAAAEALRNKVASLTINCSGDADVCKQNILNALPQSYKDALGDYEPFIFAGASSGEGDDASTLVKKYHGTPLLYGKKIYTVEEAMEATKNGERFHVGLTYK